MLLDDVKALTLHHGQMTNARRSSPVPQVRTPCIESAVVNVVACFCSIIEVDLDKKFGKIEAWW